MVWWCVPLLIFLLLLFFMHFFSCCRFSFFLHSLFLSHLIRIISFWLMSLQYYIIYSSIS